MGRQLRGGDVGGYERTQNLPEFILGDDLAPSKVVKGGFGEFDGAFYIDRAS
jgi:hypothetical protein